MSQDTVGSPGTQQGMSQDTVGSPSTQQEMSQDTVGSPGTQQQEMSQNTVGSINSPQQMSQDEPLTVDTTKRVLFLISHDCIITYIVKWIPETLALILLIKEMQSDMLRGARNRYL
ncbi:hypothetical protein KUTeg_017534 [Tegillarca granosa]|uniref:Uncharacterized protein n=1 Tax=Tegillarca granosa TaxID=220873 RepID=A0ABQ9EF61_TEGGR|nr:hypothetical protein KUTeg_017534 [Tegillarca granosa]